MARAWSALVMAGLCVVGLLLLVVAVLIEPQPLEASLETLATNPFVWASLLGCLGAAGIAFHEYLRSSTAANVPTTKEEPGVEVAGPPMPRATGRRCCVRTDRAGPLRAVVLAQGERWCLLDRSGACCAVSDQNVGLVFDAALHGRRACHILMRDQAHPAVDFDRMLSGVGSSLLVFRFNDDSRIMVLNPDEALCSAADLEEANWYC